jgi:transposase-like protein
MEKRTSTPETLLGAICYFSDPDVALAFLAGLRWPNGPTCPECESTDPSFLKTRRIWKCRECKRQFSVKVGTIFEDSPIGLDKWLPCLWMLANCKNGISSYEVARALGVTQKTAWFMLHRIRLAMQTKTFKKVGGEVEVDETFIGGRARFMHKSKRARVIKGTGGLGKVAVMGLLERGTRKKHSKVRLAIVKNPPSRRDLHEPVHEHVKRGARVYTDALQHYEGLDSNFAHAVVDHSIQYVRGRVHTNGLENFWSLLKRAIKGTYVSVEPFHVFRYLDEQSFRFNNRKMTDGGRFLSVARSIFGKRLTYDRLIGANLSAAQTC